MDSWYGSDLLVERLSTLGVRHIAINPGASIRGLVAIGVVVGVLGGVVGVPEDSDDGIDMTVRVAGQ